MAKDQPFGPDHVRHGCNGPLLPRRPRGQARGHSRDRHVPPLLLELGPTARWHSSSRLRPPLRRSPSPLACPTARAPQFDHLALNLPDEEALLQLQRRLKAADHEVTDIVDHGSVRSVYFTDPDGIALEASWWVHDPTGRPVDYTDQGQFGDGDPVPAVRELQAADTLTSTPSTASGLTNRTSCSVESGHAATPPSPSHLLNTAPTNTNTEGEPQ